jgi:hypothetical protein
MRQIIDTTDSRFVGLIFDENSPLLLNGVEFVADRIQDFGNGNYRLSNSNYVIDITSREN